MLSSCTLNDSVPGRRSSQHGSQICIEWRLCWCMHLLYITFLQPQGWFHMDRYHPGIPDTPHMSMLNISLFLHAGVHVKELLLLPG